MGIAPLMTHFALNQVKGDAASQCLEVPTNRCAAPPPPPWGGRCSPVSSRMQPC